MRIAIDARMVLPYPTGIGRVVDNLVQSLIKVDQENEYVVICLPHALKDVSAPNLRKITTEIGQHQPKVFTALPSLLKKEAPEVAHWHYFIKPFSSPCPDILSLYDTIPMILPQLIKPHERLIYKVLCPVAAKRARMIIADSESAKQDITRYLGVAEDRINVVYLGVDPRFSPSNAEAQQQFREKHNLPEHYICYVGNHKAHKNLKTLVAAFARTAKNIPHKLVFLDSPDPDCSETKAVVEAEGVTDRVVFLQKLPDAELPHLYGSADLFVFPSLYEGFGLPPLEAMACGTPVISSNSSSLPEVVGDAGILFNPTDIDALANAINRVLNDKSLSNDLQRRGLERAKQFNWEETARQTLKIYKEVARSR